MWYRTEKYSLENEGEGNYDEIYLCDETATGGNYYILAYGVVDKFLKFFNDRTAAENHFDKLAKKLGAVSVQKTVDFPDAEAIEIVG